MLIVGCDCDEKSDSQGSETPDTPPKTATVIIQTVGVTVEGLIVCNEETCKQTDSDGMVTFDANGSFSFRINDMNVITMLLPSNRTAITPYTLFENNASLANWFELALYAFDKESSPSDATSVLTFSPYIPAVNDFRSFIEADINDTNVSYEVNDNNISIDGNLSAVLRNGTLWNVTVISPSTYKNMERVSEFIARGESGKVSLFEGGEALSFGLQSLTSFTLGTRYIIGAQVEDDNVIMTIYDAESGQEDLAHYIGIGEDNLSLITDIVTFSIVE